jgi:hypothetical protein
MGVASDARIVTRALHQQGERSAEACPRSPQNVVPSTAPSPEALEQKGAGFLKPPLFGCGGLRQGGFVFEWDARVVVTPRTIGSGVAAALHAHEAALLRRVHYRFTKRRPAKIEIELLNRKGGPVWKSPRRCVSHRRDV